jgi:hypothetical protein
MATKASVHSRAEAVAELALMLPDFAVFYCDHMNRLDLWPNGAKTPRQMMMDFAQTAIDIQLAKMDWVGGSYYRIGVEPDGPDWSSFARFEDEMDYPWIPEDENAKA